MTQCKITQFWSW